MKEYLANTLGVPPANFHFTIIYCIGILVQGAYQFLTSPDSFNICHFFVYISFAFCSSVMYYKVFKSK